MLRAGGRLKVRGLLTGGECVCVWGVPAGDGNDCVLLPVDDDYGAAAWTGEGVTLFCKNLEARGWRSR